MSEFIETHEGARQYARWEKAFERVSTPMEEFLHRENTSSWLLLGCTIVAMVVVNSALGDHYFHLLHTELSIRVGSFELAKTIHHWVNDGLMALFFFVVGLEIKREVLVGELADPRKAALPMIAAIGGMVVPALVYLVFNPSGGTASGWAIPMATDIAFAIGALMALGTRVPAALVTFLLALAIVDDLGAVVVIALFYTEQINVVALIAAGVIIAVLVALNLFGVRRAWPYFLLGLVLWVVVLKSGIHATLAGVITAFTIPTTAKYHRKYFRMHTEDLMKKFTASKHEGATVLDNEIQKGILSHLESTVKLAQTPLQRLEHSMHVPVALLVIPLFALANAGIPVSSEQLAQSFTNPILWGVVMGLVFGKAIGISGACWLAVRMGACDLPSGTGFSHFVGVGLIGGIGFTMSIFIGELAFGSQPEYLLVAKTAILMASVLAAVIGIVWLLVAGSGQDQDNK